MAMWVKSKTKSKTDFSNQLSALFWMVTIWFFITFLVPLLNKGILEKLHTDNVLAREYPIWIKPNSEYSW